MGWYRTSRMVVDVLKGVSNDKLENEIKGDISAQARANAINSLLSAGRLQLFSAKEGLVYKEVNQEEALR